MLDRGSDGDLSAGGSDLSWQTQRVDGGTIFPGNGGSRDPKAPQQVPSATLAVEHYNRIVRLLERGQPVRMEVNIQTKFHPETDPGGQRASTSSRRFPAPISPNEVVIMGAHFDTYPVRDRRHRQRHRIGGDDRSGARDPDARAEAAPHDSRRAVGGGGTGPARLARLRAAALLRRARPRRRSRATRTSQAYFNLDNGTGRILGIWGQGNTGAMKIFEQWGEALKDLGWKNVEPAHR